MQNLVRSKTIGVTGNGGRDTAGAGPGRDRVGTFIEVFSLISEFLDFGFLLSVWVESLCLCIYVCFVIFVIMRNEDGSDPRGHLWVTWGVYLCAGKPPLADIILSHPPDLTRCDSVIGLAIPAMSGHIQY